MTRFFRRLATMDGAEIAWRARVTGRTLAQRGAFAIRKTAWRRTELLRRLAPLPSTAAARRALQAGDWGLAHQCLQRHMLERSPRFVVSPRDRGPFAAAIASAYPAARTDSIARGDRMLDGFHDLLGYRGLRFGGDWHYDPVNNRRAPRRFFSQVAYLNPRFGDHKVVWELNRHQHWLVYGRAYWLSGDAKYRSAVIAELTGWLDANPPLTGINWVSMLELGFRSISWLWALHLFSTPDGAADSEPWSVDLLLALDRQLTHVEQNLSHYFSPNTHLLGEALALYVTGMALPELAASRRRADLGRRVLIAEVTRQIAPDGFHCERSTHYHRYTLDFYSLALAVARITHDPIAAAFERAVDRLAAAAEAIADDHGRAPHLGDDDGGMLLPIAGRDADDWRDSLATAAVLTGRRPPFGGEVPEETAWIAGPALADNGASGSAGARAAEHFSSGASTALATTGYYISRSSDGEHLVFDGGPHGYRNAGHAHADALSMTLSLRGRPLLIDPGTACYTIDPGLRNRFRSTAAHNTMVLDDRPQSCVAGPFHWAQTADAVTHRWRAAGAFDYFDASHRGYAPVTHRRRVLVMHGNVVVVVDSVEGTGRHRAAVHWHVDDAWSAAARSRAVDFAAGNERVGMHVLQGAVELFSGDGDSGLGWQSPVYGKVAPATTVRVVHEAQAPFSIVTVFDLDPLDPIEQVELLPVWAEAGAIATSCAIRIVRNGFTDYAAWAERTATAAHPLWRIAEFETDAHLLFCRVATTGDIARVAMVDGSLVRGGGRRSLAIAIGRIIPSVVIDEPSIRNFTPCAALPVS